VGPHFWETVAPSSLLLHVVVHPCSEALGPSYVGKTDPCRWRPPTGCGPLQEAVREKQREADRLLCNNPHLAELSKRKAEIERKTQALEEQSAELARSQAQLDRVQACWLPKLRLLVGRIRHYVCDEFREMAVAGEVVLDERGDDFKASGIRIRVQFRDTRGDAGPVGAPPVGRGKADAEPSCQTQGLKPPQGRVMRGCVLALH